MLGRKKMFLLGIIKIVKRAISIGYLKVCGGSQIKMGKFCPAKSNVHDQIKMCKLCPMQILMT